MIAYRVYFRRSGSWGRYREKSIVLLGEAALERQLARKAPTVVWFEPVGDPHRCQACGAEAIWDENWRAWPRYGKRHELRGEGEDIYCSDDCLRSENPDARPPNFLQLNEEPRDKAQLRALWRAYRRDEEQVAAARKAVRGVPMPEWKGAGWCKWCGEKIEEKGRSSWHAECVKTYWLHTDASVQLRFLAKRDGHRCAWPGCEGCGPLEVDHKVPLWSVAHLPDDQRRRYFGPDNLWLLGHRHHKAKTKLEAADRAAQRRQRPPEAQPKLFSD